MYSSLPDLFACHFLIAYRWQTRASQETRNIHSSRNPSLHRIPNQLCNIDIPCQTLDGLGIHLCYHHPGV